MSEKKRATFAGAPVMSKRDFLPVRAPRIDVSPLLHAAIIDAIQRGGLVANSVAIPNIQHERAGMKAEISLIAGGGQTTIYGTLTLEHFACAVIDGELKLTLAHEHENREWLKPGDYAVTLGTRRGVAKIIKALDRDGNSIPQYEVEYPSGAHGRLSSRDLLGLPTNVGIVEALSYLFRCVRNDVAKLQEIEKEVDTGLKEIEGLRRMVPSGSENLMECGFKIETLRRKVQETINGAITDKHRFLSTEEAEGYHPVTGEKKENSSTEYEAEQIAKVEVVADMMKGDRELPHDGVKIADGNFRAYYKLPHLGTGAMSPDGPATEKFFAFLKDNNIPWDQTEAGKKGGYVEIPQQFKQEVVAFSQSLLNEE